MPGDTAFEALLDGLESDPPLAAAHFIRALKESYGLAHVLYGDCLDGGRAPQSALILHDDNPPLKEALAKGGARLLSPLLALLSTYRGPSRIDLETAAADIPALLQVLDRCDLLRPAIVFPLVPTQGGTAFFLCFSKLRDGFHLPRRQLFGELSALAGLFHAGLANARRAADASPLGQKTQVSLTPRESEVLHWVAAGKSYWEIGRILDISERTVRHFMANNRQKLDAVSNKQAVAKAVASGLVKL